MNERIREYHDGIRKLIAKHADQRDEGDNISLALYTLYADFDGYEGMALDAMVDYDTKCAAAAELLKELIDAAADRHVLYRDYVGEQFDHGHRGQFADCPEYTCIKARAAIKKATEAGARI